MPKISVDFGVTCSRKVGHIECPKFVETGVKFVKTKILPEVFLSYFVNFLVSINFTLIHFNKTLYIK